MIKMWSEILEQPEVLERCKNKNSKIISNIVDILYKNNIGNIVIAARGTSNHAAIYGKYVLELLTRKPVSLASPSIFTLYGGGLDVKNSLVIGISQSGMAQDVLEVMKNANNSGAITVGITNYNESPIAKESKVHLNCEAGEEKSVAATKTFTAQMFLLAYLASEWGNNDELKQELIKLPTHLLNVFKVADDIEKNVTRYRFANECFVLARGFNYAIALEAALKIQETTYVRAKAFATSEFQHGPIAMIESNIPVILFVPEGPSFNDLSGMLMKLKESQIETVVVSNNKKILEEGTCAFEIPETNNDAISPFFNAIVAQMFACKLSLVKGLNPDTPRRLSKVTITK